MAPLLTWLNAGQQREGIGPVRCQMERIESLLQQMALDGPAGREGTAVDIVIEQLEKKNGGKGREKRDARRNGRNAFERKNWHNRRQ